MPRKPKNSFVTEPPPDPADIEQALPAEEQSEVFADDSVSKIFSVLATMNLSGGKVGIHLKRPNALKTTYEGYMTIEQFKEDGLETLKNTYGGGDYTLQFQDSNGKFVTSQNISIDPRFKGSVEAPAAALAAAAPDKTGELATALDKLRPAPADNNGMTQILVAMIDANQKMLTAMMSAIAAKPTAPPPAAAPEPVLPILLELIRQKTDKTPISETIEAFATLRDLTAGNREPKDKEDMVEKVVKIFGPALASFLARQGGMPMMPPPAQLNPGPPQQQAPPPPAANGAAPEEPKLAQFTGLLLNAANRGTPAENYYDVIVDNITDDQFDTLITELKKPDWLENLFGNIPPVIAQKAWFEKLRAAFLEDAGEIEDAEGRAGNPLPAAGQPAAHAGAHGVTRPTSEATK